MSRSLVHYVSAAAWVLLAVTFLNPSLVLARSSESLLDTVAYERFKEAFARNDRDGLQRLSVECRRPGSAASGDLALLALAAAEFRSDRMGEAQRLLDSLLSKEMGLDPLLGAVAHKINALVLRWAGDESGGFAEVDAGLELADSVRYPDERVDLMVVRAELLNARGESGAALIWLERASALALRTGYDRGVCLVRINLGNIRFARKDYEGAWREYEGALSCASGGGFDMIAQNAVSNLASSAVMMERFDVALHLFDSLTNALGDGSPVLLARIYGQRGFVNRRKGNDLAAIEDFGRALEVSTSLGDRSRIAKVLQHLSGSEWNIGKRFQAIHTLESALRMAQELRSPELEIEAHATLWTWLEELGDYRSALAHAYSMASLQDSLARARFDERMAIAEVRFDTERKEHQLSEQAQQLQLATLEHRRQLVQRAALWLTVVAIGITALLLWRGLRTRKRLAAKERQLHAQQVDDLLHQQELKAMNAMLEGQEKERDRVAKDLHDRLGSMLSAIKHQVGALEGRVETLGRAQDDRYVKVNDLLDDAVGEVRRISHDLIATTLARFGLAKALEDLCASVRITGRLDVELRLFGLEQRLERSVEIVVYRIVQELVSNVLKHAKASELSVSVTRVPGRLSLIVADDGRGFDTQERRAGIGLENVQARAASVGATVQVDSTPGQGTTVSVECPVVE